MDESPAEAGPSSPSPPARTDTGYLDDADPNLDLTLRLHSRIHKQTIERVRAEHEREYGGAAGGPDEIDFGNTPDRNTWEDDGSTSDASSSSGEWSTSISELEREREEQFQEAVEQLELTFRLIVFPLFGKWMGRKWAYWAFARYQLHGGLNLRFFGLNWVPDTAIPSWAVAAWGLVSGS